MFYFNRSVYVLSFDCLKTKRVLYIWMMIIAFIATYFLDVSAMIVILVCLGIGIIDLLIYYNKKKGEVA